MSVCTVTSLIYVKQIKDHTKAIRQCILLIENIKILIEYKNLSIEEIFENICKSANYRLLTFLDDIRCGIGEYHKTLNNIFSEKRTLNGFDDEDLEYLKGFFSMLGGSDTCGQIINCDLYKNFFEKKYLQLEKNEKSKCKSTLTVILGVGTLFSIIVI